MCACASQRLRKMTQATDSWLPADDDAKLRVTQQRQRQQITTTTSNSRVAAAVADTPIQLVDFRPRPRDVTHHVTADQDGGHVNAAFDQAQRPE